MNRDHWAGKAKLALSVFFLVLCVGMGVRSREGRPDGRNDPERMAHAERADFAPECSCGKVHPDYAGRGTCAPPASQLHLGAGLAAPFGSVLERTPNLAGEPGFRRVSVTDLVERALADQREMLQAKLTELTRWSPPDRAEFAKWFGTTAEEARRLIGLRVARALELNKNYSANNFRRANPPRPGVYAYVRASQPSRVYVDRLFLAQPSTGEDSRAGTITHEMSHFTIVGGTKDHAYGTLKCKALARTSPLLALDNADNFEFWAEGAR
jgi:hypothetical protein